MGALNPLLAQTASICARIVALAICRQFQVSRYGTRWMAPIAMCNASFPALTFLYGDFLPINLGDLRIPEPPRLLDRLRWAIRVRHNSPRTEECYVGWVERFIRFHRMRHPKTMGGARSNMSPRMSLASGGC